MRLRLHFHKPIELLVRAHKTMNKRKTPLRSHMTIEICSRSHKAMEFLVTFVLSQLSNTDESATRLTYFSLVFGTTSVGSMRALKHRTLHTFVL